MYAPLSGMLATRTQIGLRRTARLAWSSVAMAALGLAVGAEQTAAQSTSRPDITFSAGIVGYDLSGTGTAGTGAVGVSFPVTSFLTIEPALGFLRYSSQGGLGSHISFVMPEVSARLQANLSRVKPYLSAGTGFASVIEGRGETDLTLHAGVGTYIWLNRSWAIRPEGRVRSIDPFVGSTGQLTFGVSRKL